MKKKCYLNAKEIRKSIYKSMMSKKYNLVFTDDKTEADIFVIPEEVYGLTDEQRVDLDYATMYGIDIRVIDAALLDKNSDDPLMLIDALKEREIKYTNDEMEYGLEI